MVHKKKPDIVEDAVESQDSALPQSEKLRLSSPFKRADSISTTTVEAEPALAPVEPPQDQEPKEVEPDKDTTSESEASGVEKSITDIAEKLRKGRDERRAAAAAAKLHEGKPTAANREGVHDLSKTV